MSATNSPNVRPPADITNQAKAVLESRGREIRGFVMVCLAALNADLDAFLEFYLTLVRWPRRRCRSMSIGPPRS
jgi:hypothetical protein